MEEENMAKFHNLNDLINSDTHIKNYFDSLPDYVQEQINTRPTNINSFASLRDYAENLLRGDD